MFIFLFAKSDNLNYSLNYKAFLVKRANDIVFQLKCLKLVYVIPILSWCSLIPSQLSGMISAMGRVVPVHADTPKLLPPGEFLVSITLLLHLASALDLPLCVSALGSTEPSLQRLLADSAMSLLGNLRYLGSLLCGKLAEGKRLKIKYLPGTILNCSGCQASLECSERSCILELQTGAGYGLSLLFLASSAPFLGFSVSLSPEGHT